MQSCLKILSCTSEKTLLKQNMNLKHIFKAYINELGAKYEHFLKGFCLNRWDFYGLRSKSGGSEKLVGPWWAGG